MRWSTINRSSRNRPRFDGDYARRLDTDASSGGENQAGRIVLRAWGRGALANDANEIAGLFERALAK